MKYCWEGPLLGPEGAFSALEREPFCGILEWAAQQLPAPRPAMERPGEAWSILARGNLRSPLVRWSQSGRPGMLIVILRETASMVDDFEESRAKQT